MTALEEIVTTAERMRAAGKSLDEITVYVEDAIRMANLVTSAIL